MEYEREVSTLVFARRLFLRASAESVHNCSDGSTLESSFLRLDSDPALRPATLSTTILINEPGRQVVVSTCIPPDQRDVLSARLRVDRQRKDVVIEIEEIGSKGTAQRKDLPFGVNDIQ